MSVFTLDASIFGNAVFADEPGHAASRDLLTAISVRGHSAGLADAGVARSGRDRRSPDRLHGTC